MTIGGERGGRRAVNAEGVRQFAWRSGALFAISFCVALALWRGLIPLLLPASDHVSRKASASLEGVAPAAPWRSLDHATVLTRIGVGSCLDQTKPQAIWQAIIDRSPQLFLMMGDNVYGDIKSDDARELADAYRQQLDRAEFSAARKAIPMLGIWDDHDYGGNDAGADFASRIDGERLFRVFWQRPADELGHGVYYAESYGPPGKRVQIIFLDTRSFRSPLKQKGAAFSFWGRYEPDPDPTKTMLGAAQWTWLEQKLKEPAELRLIVSSVQVLAEGHGFERWGNLPAERERLISLLQNTEARGVVLLSGDRHHAALFERRLEDGRVLPELTSSALNKPVGPPRDVAGSERRGEPYWRENFGEIDIDWQGHKLTLNIRNIEGSSVESWTLPFAALGLPSSP